MRRREGRGCKKYSQGRDDGRFYAAADADGQGIAIAFDEAPFIAAPADPADRLVAVGCGAHEIAEA